MGKKLEVKIPEFLMRKHSKEDMPELYWLDKEYREKFGETYGTEGLIMTDEEWTDVIKRCLEENKTVDELLGLGLSEMDDDDDI